MMLRKRLALWAALALFASTPAGAYAARKPDPLAGREWGAVTGYILDRATGRPVAGARITLEQGDAFAAKGPTVGATDASGLYRVKALIGRKSSHFDLMSLIDGFPIGLLMPWGLFKQTRVVDAHQFVARVEKPGYKPFVGIVSAQVVSAQQYAVHNVDVLLAPESGTLLSSAPPDRPRERLLSYSFAPAVAAPGEKVTFTAKFLLPHDGVKYSSGWYTQDKQLFGFEDFSMKADRKRDPETGAVTYRAFLTVPRKPHADWASLRLWLDRAQRYHEVKLPQVHEMLLQVARTPADRPAAEAAQQAFDLEQQGQPAEALAAYRKAAEAAPKRASLWARIGQLSLQLNRVQDAIVAYEKLPAADPDDKEGNATRLATALLAAGDTQKALDTLTAVEKKVDKRKRMPREFLLALARTYLAKDDLKVADGYYERAVKIGRVPDEVAQQFHLERARAAVKATPDNPDARAGLARALFDLKRYDEAAVEYREALRREPTNPWTHLDLASSLVAAHRDRDALRSYQQAVALAPQNLEARLGMAECDRRLGDFPAALAEYRRLAATPARSGDFHVQHGLGLMLLAAGDEKGATDALAQAVVLGRVKGKLNDLRVQTGFGVLSLTTRKVSIDDFRYPEAALDYELLDSLATLKKCPDDAGATYQAGAALIELGLAKQGLEKVQQAAARGFRPADAAYLTAMANLRLGRRDEARHTLEDVVRQDPGHRRALLALAGMAFDAGDTAAGQAYLVQAQH